MTFREKDAEDIHNLAQIASDPLIGSTAVSNVWDHPLESEYDPTNIAALELKGKVNKKASTAVVIVAGGSATRFKHDGGKQLFEMAGKPVLTWAIEAFDAVSDIGQIVVVCPKGRQDEYRINAIEPFPFITPIDFAESGEVRQESAMNGLDKVSADYEYIAIHDGARPLITPNLIKHALNTLKGNLDIDGVVVGHPSIDTLKVVEDNRIIGTPQRKMFWVAQTPQIFRADIIRRAYSAAMFEGFVGTDDSSLVERLGGYVEMINGSRDNIKVTVPEDIGPATASLYEHLHQRENQ